MSGVGLWIRAELRTRWRALLGLALLLGIGGGAVIAIAAGARRTDTAHERFLVAQKAADVALFDDGFFGGDVSLDDVARLPQVAEVARTGIAFYTVDNNVSLAAVDERLGTAVNRFKIIEGRMYDVDKVDEVVVGFGVARNAKLHVGDTFELVPPEIYATACGDPPDPACVSYLDQFKVTLRIVGIIAAPGEFPPQFVGSFPSIHMTPAFFRKIGNAFADEPIGPERGSLFIRLKRGAADLPAFRAAFRELAGPGKLEFLSSAEETGSLTKRAFHFQALALWLLAAFGAIAISLILAQTLARQVFIASSEFPTLRALGVGGGELLMIGLTRAAVIGGTGAIVAVGLAAGLSPLAPLGDARIAEPHPGFAFDATALGIGGTCIVALALVASMVPAWRAARAAGAAGADQDLRRQPSRVAVAAARAGLPAPAVAGARLALEQGRGRTALPVRSTLAALVVGVAVLCGALTFGASLTHLLDTPQLYGVRWDTQVTSYGTGADLRPRIDALKAVPGIVGLTLGGEYAPLQVNGKGTGVMTVTPLRGAAHPPIVEGKLPTAADEIALTAPTMRRTGKGIGDRVAVRPPVTGARTYQFRVVGRTVVPPTGQSISESGPGEGGLISQAGADRLGAGLEESLTKPTSLLIRFAPGVDHQRVLDAVEPLMGLPKGDPGLTDTRPETPGDIVTFGSVDSLPVVLGAILGVIAAGTLAHTIASSARRRRGDLAILKTLGFLRRQLRSTVAWQATLLTATALAVGIPSGVIFGRWTFRLFADQLGMVPESFVDTASIILVLPAALVLANLIAAIPGRVAARVPAAVVLRTE